MSRGIAERVGSFLGRKGDLLAWALLVLSTSSAAAQQPLSTEVLLTNVRGLYAPSVLTHQGVKRMWTGGWLTDDDPQRFLASGSCGQDLSQVVGADKIFYSELVNGAWTWPVLALAKVGFHVNDPSVIQPPSSDGIDRRQWLYLYYTALHNNDARCGRFDRSHRVGFASSLDGGRTWTDHGIVIDAADGGDGFGAWAPSAVVVGNDIWVYYHTGTPDFAQPINFRLRFNLTGWQKLSGPERLTFVVPEVSPVLVSNLDVSLHGSQWVLVANTTDLRTIVRYVSQDGLVWVRHPHDVNPLIGGGPNLVLTPHAELVSADRSRVSFGLDSGAGSTSLHAWEFLLPPPYANGAQFLSQSVPPTVPAGGQAAVSITLRNIGTTSWTAAAQHRLGSQNPQDNATWGTARVTLASTEAIAPGQQKAFTFTLTAPSVPGTYNFQWRMVQEGVEGFGELTPNVVVTVTSTTIFSGDLDGNGKRDLADVRLLIYMLIGQIPKTPEADLTGDGAVTLADVQALIRLLVGL